MALVPFLSTIPTSLSVAPPTPPATAAISAFPATAASVYPLPTARYADSLRPLATRGTFVTWATAASVTFSLTQPSAPRAPLAQTLLIVIIQSPALRTLPFPSTRSVDSLFPAVIRATYATPQDSASQATTSPIPRSVSTKPHASTALIVHLVYVRPPSINQI